MIAYAVAWALCATLATFVVLTVVVALEIREHRAAQRPEPVPAPRIPQQRQPSAAVVVEIVEGETFEEFLAELIVTPHVEDVLS